MDPHVDNPATLPLHYVLKHEQLALTSTCINDPLSYAAVYRWYCVYTLKHVFTSEDTSLIGLITADTLDLQLWSKGSYKKLTPTNVDYFFFYCTNYGIYHERRGMNGGLSKSIKNGDIGLWQKPLPPCGFNPSKCFL